MTQYHVKISETEWAWRELDELPVVREVQSTTSQPARMSVERAAARFDHLNELKARVREPNRLRVVHSKRVHHEPQIAETKVAKPVGVCRCNGKQFEDIRVACDYAVKCGKPVYLNGHRTPVFDPENMIL